VRPLPKLSVVGFVGVEEADEVEPGRLGRYDHLRPVASSVGDAPKPPHLSDLAISFGKPEESLTSIEVASPTA
jgi:hypothetical protein